MSESGNIYYKTGLMQFSEDSNVILRQLRIG